MMAPVLLLSELDVKNDAKRPNPISVELEGGGIAALQSIGIG